MLSSFLLFHVFVATLTLAAPATSGEQAGTAPIAATVTVPAASTDAQDVATNNWAGLALTVGSNAAVHSVTGAFQIPAPAPPPGGDIHEVYESAAWIGIGGYNCDSESALLRTGVTFIYANGDVNANAWYEWYPSVDRTYYDINVSIGDLITASVTAYTSRSGTVTLINNSTGAQTSVTLGSAEYATLCMNSVEYIVGDTPQPNGGEPSFPFPAFGTLAFSDAFVSITPSASPLTNLLNIEQGEAALTSVSTEYDTITIKYIGDSE